MSNKNKFYSVIIKLTAKNDEDEKEFIIDKMEQILLLQMAANPGIARETNVTKIYMLKGDYYINDDVLQQITQLSKKQYSDWKFINYQNMTSEVIFLNFYTFILNINNVNLKYDTIYKTIIYILKKIIIKKLKDYNKLRFTQDTYKELAKEFDKQPNTRDIPKAEVVAANAEWIQKQVTNIIYLINNLLNENEDNIKRNINENESNEDAIENLKKDFINEIIDIYETNNTLRLIMLDKNIMDNIRSIYETDKSNDALEFHRNLSTIMLNYQETDGIEIYKLEKYEYFLNKKNINYIFETISLKTDSITDSKANFLGSMSSQLSRPILYNEEKKKQIIKDNMKYVYPDKTNIDTLVESEKQDIILFHNILYIIKKIYLIDTTIIVAEDIDSDKTKKFYIKNITLEENNPFKQEYLSNTNYEATIRFKCDITYININPILKINYIIDDQELLEKNTPLKMVEFNPNNFTKIKYSKPYKSIFIYDNINYREKEYNINKIFNTIKIQKIIKNKEEIFYNDTALNIFNEELNIEGPGVKEAKKKDNISSNILYFLKDVLKLYKGCEFNDNNNKYFVYDTLISTDISNSEPKFYSISQGKSIQYNNLKKDKILKIFKKKHDLLISLTNTTNTTETTDTTGNASTNTPLNEVWKNDKYEIYKLAPKDSRIGERNTYTIFIVLLCYKADANGNKPDIQKRLITEVCLDRAKTLDKAFYDLFYNRFNISETFLYNKLVNVRKSKQAVTVKNKDKDASNLQTNIVGKKINNYTQKIKRK